MKNLKEFNLVSLCCGTKMNLTVEVNDKGQLFLDHSELCSSCLDTAEFVETPEETETDWDFNEEGDYDIAPQPTYVDYGHVDGIKEYTELDALYVIKKILSEDDALLNGRDIEIFTTSDLLEIGSQFFDIRKKQST